jgi:phosphotransferase system HPr (HPr) family protein
MLKFRSNPRLEEPVNWGKGGDVVEKEVTVVPENGLHGRPAVEFVKAVKRFNSDIKVIKDDVEANARSPLSLTSRLGAKQGDKLIIRAEGEDEEEAVEALVELLSQQE